MIGISTLHFAIRLLLAIAMGATVGLERQWRQRMAGTRTNALVAAGAAAFVMCGLLLDNDPSARGRIVSYVVSGVGFLGAGVIFKDGANVRGLNTAATIWCSAAIGALTGLGSLNLALVLAAAVLLTNMVLRPLAYLLHPVLPDASPVETLYEIRLTCGLSVAVHIRSLLLTTISRLPVVLQSIHGEQDEQTDETHIRAEVMTAGRNNEALEQVVVRLSIEDAVSNLSWSIVQSSME
ncbi:MgtC/SapB family protein [Granulicella mallensis]|jgi:putative Mg2+ transporter-C (MgtC) family protein|uniref:Protein MgtC n=2 Tax=Granulicella mallensis TaxID=940614 RepID=G8NX68_GRAMM|nr:MgtC/SapB family protein [Granulicella mallensis]AEU36682.1 MgtC/SapB transporter [Granulicella mallensis MP5ACTX8]MBB5062273.1 putative Mg2+ transporter-C (MgtC) family protein [Granulicella mallensis]